VVPATRAVGTLGYVETRIGDRTELAVVGDLDLTTIELLITAAARVISDGPSHLVLNLAGVPFMDSTGLVALVRIRRMCEEVGCSLGLAELGRFVVDLVTRTGLHAYLNTIEPVADAL